MTTNGVGRGDDATREPTLALARAPERGGTEIEPYRAGYWLSLTEPETWDLLQHAARSLTSAASQEADLVREDERFELRCASAAGGVVRLHGIVRGSSYATYVELSVKSYRPHRWVIIALFLGAFSASAIAIQQWPLLLIIGLTPFVCPTRVEPYDSLAAIGRRGMKLLHERLRPHVWTTGSGYRR